MLRVCDQFPLQLQTKGGMVKISPNLKRVIITSNNPPHMWWKVPMDQRAFARRITKCIEVTELETERDEVGSVILETQKISSVPDSDEEWPLVEDKDLPQAMGFRKSMQLQFGKELKFTDVCDYGTCLNDHDNNELKMCRKHYHLMMKICVYCGKEDCSMFRAGPNTMVGGPHEKCGYYPNCDQNECHIHGN